MRKILLGAVALAGLGLAQPQAQAAVFIANIDGNDCSGVFGTGAGCVAQGTFNGTTLNPTPLVAKFDFNENGTISATTIGSQFVGIVTGSEFTFSGVASGVLTYTYIRTGDDPALQYVAIKASNEFNLYSVAASGTDTVTTPLNQQGRPRGTSHISFYDTRVTPPPVTVPEPASLLLFGAGLLGLGAARRARRAA